jgi:hypothetical protein
MYHTADFVNDTFLAQKQWEMTKRHIIDRISYMTRELCERLVLQRLGVTVNYVGLNADASISECHVRDD